MNTPPLPADVPFHDRVNAAPEVETYLLRDNGPIPNNPRLPLLVYRAALRLPPDDPAAAFEAVFARWDWKGQWRNGVYSFHHYHSTSHEALGIYAGQAKVRFGGEGPLGITAVVRAGDLVVIPAGVGHCNLGGSGDFGVVGAYPDGHTWDLLRGLPGERPQADRNIAGLPLPKHDPVYGADGPLRQKWR